MRTLLAILVGFLAFATLQAADTPAPVTLPDVKPDGPRLTLGRPTEFATTVLAFSPDGKTLAATTNRGYTGGMKAPVHLWDAETGRHLHTLDWHTVGVMSAAFSPDGALLATAGIDNQLRFWDAKSGKDVTKRDLPLSGHGYAVCFSPDGKRLLVGSTRLEVYEVAGQAPLKEKPGYFAETARNQFFHTATWSPKGKYVAAACDGAGVRVWEADTGNLVRQITPDYTVHRTRFAFSADDKLLHVSRWPKGVMATFDVESGRELKAVPVPKGEAAPEQVQFAREKDRVAWVVQVPESWSGGRGVVVADTAGQELKRFGVPAGVLSHVLSRDGGRLAVGGQDGSLRVYDPETGKPVAVMLGAWSPVFRTTFADAGKLIRVTHTGGAVHDFDADTGKLLRDTQLALREFRHPVAASPDGKRFASAAEGGEFALWDAATGAQLAKSKTALHVYRERTGVIGGPFPLPPPPLQPGGPGGVRQPPPPLEHVGPPQFFAAFSADGTLFVALTGKDGGGPVVVWDSATGTEKHSLKVPTGVGALALSADGTHLFAGQARQTAPPPADGDPQPQPAFLHRFDLKTGKEVQSWKPLPAAERKDGKYSYSRVESLHPLPGGATLAVVEVQVYSPWPPPPLPAGARAPVTEHAFVRLIDLPGREKDRVIETERRGGVGASPDGSRVWFTATVMPPQPGPPRAVVRIVDVASGKVTEADLGEARHSPTAALTFRPDGKEFVATGGDGVLGVWEVAKLKERKVELPEAKRE